MSPALKLVSEDFWSVGWWIQISGKQTLAIKRAWTRTRSFALSMCPGMSPLYAKMCFGCSAFNVISALNSWTRTTEVLSSFETRRHEVARFKRHRGQTWLGLGAEWRWTTGQPMADQNMLVQLRRYSHWHTKVFLVFANCWRIVSLGPEHVNWDQLGTPLSRKLSMAEWPNMALTHRSSMFPMSPVKSVARPYTKANHANIYYNKYLLSSLQWASLVTGHAAATTPPPTMRSACLWDMPRCRHIRLTSHVYNVTSCFIMSQNQGPPSGSKPGQQPRASGNDVICQQKLECPIPASKDRGPNRSQLRCERNTSLWNGPSNAFNLAWIRPAKPLFFYSMLPWTTGLRTARESDLWCHAVATSAVESCNQLLREWTIYNRKKTLTLLAGNCELWPARITADRT